MSPQGRTGMYTCAHWKGYIRATMASAVAASSESCDECRMICTRHRVVNDARGRGGGAAGGVGARRQHKRRKKWGTGHQNDHDEPAAPT